MNPEAHHGVTELLLEVLVNPTRALRDQLYVREADANRTEPSLAAYLAATPERLADRLAHVTCKRGIRPASLPAAVRRAAVTLDARHIRRVTLLGWQHKTLLVTCGPQLHGAHLAVDTDGDGWRAFFPYEEARWFSVVSVDQPRPPARRPAGVVPRVQDAAWAAAVSDGALTLATLTAGEPRFAELLNTACAAELRTAAANSLRTLATLTPGPPRLARLLGSAHAGAIPPDLPKAQLRMLVALRAQILARRRDDALLGVSLLPGLPDAGRLFVVRPTGEATRVARPTGREQAVRAWNAQREPDRPERDARRLLAVLGPEVRVHPDTGRLTFSTLDGVVVVVRDEQVKPLTVAARNVEHLSTTEATPALVAALRAAARARLSD